MTPEALSQIRKFGRQVEVMGDRVKIEGEGSMSFAEARAWIERQRGVQCSGCGAYRES